MRVHNCFPFKGWSWTEPILFAVRMCNFTRFTKTRQSPCLYLSVLPVFGTLCYLPCVLILCNISTSQYSQCLTDQSDPLHHLWTESHACVANKRQTKTTLNVSVCLLSMILHCCKVASGGQGVAFLSAAFFTPAGRWYSQKLLFCQWTLICNI